MEVAGANRRWRCQFRYRGSRRRSAVAQLSTLGHIRLMNITRFISWLTLASFVVLAGCTTSKPNSEQLDQLVHRTSALEQQVHNLEVSNAELQKQLRALQQQPATDAQRAKEELQKRTQEFQKQLDGHH